MEHQQRGATVCGDREMLRKQAGHQRLPAGVGEAAEADSAADVGKGPVTL